MGDGSGSMPSGATLSIFPSWTVTSKTPHWVAVRVAMTISMRAGVSRRLA